MANSVARPSPRGRLQPGKGSVICQIAPFASLGVEPRMFNLSVAAEPMVMAFYSADPAMGQKLADLVHALEQEGRPRLGAQLSITWLRYAKSLCNREAREASPLEAGSGASWRGDQLRHPGSLVNLIYLVACEAWLQRQLLRDEPELRRAMAAMVKPAPSAHGATGLIVDLLSGTTSGPSLPENRFITRKPGLARAGWLASLSENLGRRTLRSRVGLPQSGSGPPQPPDHGRHSQVIGGRDGRIDYLPTCLSQDAEPAGTTIWG
jgi:hypothetical protein